MANILLLQSYHHPINALVELLNSENHTVKQVQTEGEALQLMGTCNYDLAIFDWKQPHLNVSVCSAMRQHGIHVPILVLTEMNKLSDRITILDSGADDYLSKPFECKELKARVRALLRRSQQMNPGVFQAGSIQLNRGNYSVTKLNHPLLVRNLEYAVLEYLLQHKNQVISIETLLDRLWSSDSDATADAVRHCIMRLRKKVNSEGEGIIRTIRSQGYMING